MPTTGKDSPATPRARYRAGVVGEIKEHARRQIADRGAAALSLNAIAKTMGMTGPALYRYFAGRDDLMTELIRDAFSSLADTVRAAAETAPGRGPAPLAEALRRWALDDPHRYQLVYGTPVPGYRAPADTADTANAILALVIASFAGYPDPERRALVFWTRLHGVLSLETAGQFTGVDVDPAELYRHETESLTA